MKRLLCILLLTPFILKADSVLQYKDYWKNRKPNAAYWQQDVHYTIDAKINERTDIVSASEQLTYSNNSPDTLRFVFFHLYQNAFQPGSYCSALLPESGLVVNMAVSLKASKHHG